jgi:hypothetical protein
MDRLIGSDKHRIDYRHIIHTLVRKPGAFRRYVFREALFPSLEFRRTYDALALGGADQADLDYVRILHLGAGDGEQCVRVVLATLLAAEITPTYEAVRAEVPGERTPEGMRYLEITPPDLAVYDLRLCIFYARMEQSVCIGAARGNSHDFPIANLCSYVPSVGASMSFWWIAHMLPL